MTRRSEHMPFGMIVLAAVTVLLLFGVGQRVLDRLKLDDKTAILFMVAILAGGFIPDIPIGRNFYVNIGGSLVPMALAIYLFLKAETNYERLRAAIASVLSSAAVYAAGRLMPHEPETIVIDPNYVYGAIAGVIGYLFGRSRRSAFIAGIMGVIFADLIQGIENMIRGIPTEIRLGGAGGVDAVVISGLIAVLLAEVFGELRERLQGGTAAKDMTHEKQEGDGNK
jgi:uncharacterized membrane protein